LEKAESTSPPHPLANLKHAMKLEGNVTKIELFGAFVDVGAEREGLVHISMLKRGHINRVEDVVQEGQHVEVWVHRVDANAGRLELTMIQPLKLKWKDIKANMRVKGKVVRLEGFGAFVDIGAERPGLVHVSELSSDYVSNPSEIVNVGDEVDVTILDVDRKKRQIRLSMKESTLDFMDDEEEAEESTPTAMEFALRQALEHSEDEPQAVEKPSVKSKSVSDQDELENILSRTLQQRMRAASVKE
jgi:small subunit ribosomal protein S1